MAPSNPPNEAVKPKVANAVVQGRDAHKPEMHTEPAQSSHLPVGIGPLAPSEGAMLPPEIDETQNEPAQGTQWSTTPPA